MYFWKIFLLEKGFGVLMCYERNSHESRRKLHLKNNNCKLWKEMRREGERQGLMEEIKKMKFVFNIAWCVRFRLQKAASVVIVI